MGHCCKLIVMSLVGVSEQMGDFDCNFDSKFDILAPSSQRSNPLTPSLHLNNDNTPIASHIFVSHAPYLLQALSKFHPSH